MEIRHGRSSLKLTASIELRPAEVNVTSPAIASGVATSTLSAPATGPASARDGILEMEGPEFFRLMDRFVALFDEQCEAEDQEKATRVRFKAEAPLRPTKSPSKYPDIYYDIVRDKPSFEDTLAAIRFRVGKVKQPGNALGVRLKKSLLEAYLADNPACTKDGEQKRKMMGPLYDGRMPYMRRCGKPATNRHAVAEWSRIETCVRSSPRILKHKPKSVEGLKLQAAACLADPHALWIQEPNATAFMKSTCRFGETEGERPDA